ncbi:MAG: B12-binding domain-containing radical SAM protein [Magnetococcales bacterium]|nr:B12-binding domain-containing radical SAM protein [Magnetococcales bacterium]MBF0116793.1 B12-binding domain-containing radical SAM protein [Magnetococcales bacterium]
MKVSLLNIRGRHTKSPGIPLGITILGGVLKRDGHTIQLLDPLNLEQEETIRQIVAFGPDLIGISCMTLNFSVAVETVQQLRRQVPSDVIFCAGGLHPTVMPEDALRKLGVDFVVAGEGEIPLARACRMLKRGEPVAPHLPLIPGAAYLDSGDRLVTNPPEVLADLDFLPNPAWEDLDMELYLRPPGFIRGAIFNRVGVIMYSRGCPYLCTYCSSAAMFHRKARFHSTEYMVAQIRQLCTDYHIDAYYFTDETFGLKRSRLLHLCAGLKTIGLPWGCSTRVNLLDETTLWVMQDAGCIHIDVGVESGSQRVRDVLKRGQSRAIFEEIFAICHRLKIRAFAQVMVGCPGETRAEVAETVAMLQTLRPTFTQVSIFTPLPGTTVFEEHRAQLEPVAEYVERLNNFDIANTTKPLVNLSAMTDQEILQSRAWILRSMIYYNYINLLTWKHILFLGKTLAASLSYPRLTWRALCLAIRERRAEYLIYQLIFNYVSHYGSNPQARSSDLPPSHNTGTTQ